MRNIRGAKSTGGGGSTGTESPDSLHNIAYAKIVDLVSEGEIKGLVNGLQSVFLNGTPIQNPDGSTNFSVKSVDWRLGTQDQTYLSGFPDVENEHAVGVELKQQQPWTYAVNNLELSAVRVRLQVPQLQKSDQASGSITGYRIEYAIDLAVDDGAFQQVLSGAFDGKASSEYDRSIRIELPPAVGGWTLRVRRITANANSALISDTTNVQSITEIIDAKLRYPMRAVFGLQFDASQFQSVPTRAFELDGRIVKVPSNYDPVTRNYSGAWDGTFKLAWTDCPPWIFYDLVLNDRYGLGRLINASQVDRWGLYQIAQYCDELVSDGKGGQEPRFTCNLYLQQDDDAYKVLQDVASIFRGMVYWGAGNAVAVADMPGDIVHVYAPANVIGGQFKYVGSPRSTRFTVALVSWNDPSQQYKQVVEYVPDDEGIARYGVRSTPVSAFGCTSQGQAQRVGQWTLLTSRLETETLTFQVGLDGVLCAPGDVIGIADPNRAGRRMGGRIRSAAGRTVTLDKAPQAAAGDTLTIILPTGIAETHTVHTVDGDAITVDADFSAMPVAQSMWMLQSADLKAQLFRVLYISEVDEGTFEISATQHEPGKFDAIDSGTRIDPRPITVIPPSVQPPPTNVRLSSYNVIDQGIVRPVMTIAWDAADKAIAYQAQWRKDNGEWVTIPQTGSLSVDVTGIYQGAYVAQVRAVNALGVVSAPATSEQTQLQGKTSPPPQVTFLRTTPLVFAIQLDWGFPAGSDDTQRTEIWYSKTDDLTTAAKLSDYAYPQATTTYQGLAAGLTFFFWARLVDRSGNIGPWYPATDGVVGQSSAQESDYDKYFAGTIGKEALTQELLGSIDQIGDLGGQLEDLATQLGNVQQDVSRVDGIVAQFNPPMAGSTTFMAGSTKVMAGVWSEQAARAEADQALATRLDSVAAVAGNSKALVKVETQTRVTNEQATASQISTIQAQVADNSAAVQTVAQSYTDLNGRVSASYQIKTQVTANGRTYIAGIGVGVDNSSGIVESTVYLAASRVAILDPNGSALATPFVVQGGQVFISQALIGTGWITNLMIGDIIQSNQIGANGQPTWKFDKNGVLTQNGINSGSGYTVSDSNGSRTYDPNGTLRVREGVW